MSSLSSPARSREEIVRVPDRDALARAAAEHFVRLAHERIAAQRRFSVALSGGSTPRDLYTLLATPEFAKQVTWAQVHFFWGDERAVAPEDNASNYRMAYETLLAHVPVPPANVHRMLAEKEPEQAALDYAQTLQDFFRPAPGTLPRFDLILLGLGENGHTASLFPHTQVLRNQIDWVAAEYVPELSMYRITLTAPVINAAANILFLVSGPEKAKTVRAVLRGAFSPEKLPAQLIHAVNGQTVWLIDQPAAANL